MKTDKSSDKKIIDWYIKASIGNKIMKIVIISYNRLQKLNLRQYKKTQFNQLSVKKEILKMINFCYCRWIRSYIIEDKVNDCCD